MANGFDLSDAQALVAREDAGQDVHLKDAAGQLMYFEEDGERKPVTIGVIGAHSSTFRKLSTDRAQFAKRLGREPTPEEERQADLDMLAACTTGWSGFYVNGEALPYSKANVVKVLAAAPWIEAQVDRAPLTHDRFFGA